MRLLILCSDATRADIGQRRCGASMLAGLDRRSIAWELHRPWLPRPDLADFDAVLCWTYRHHLGENTLFHAARLEERCAGLGIPVINPVAHAAARHSWFLATWHRHGVPCARAVRFARFADFGLPYPLILRRDGVHMGRDVHRVENPGEARALIDGRLRELLHPDRRSRPGGPFDLAIEFVDTRGPDGLYRKWRSYVVGDRVIPRMLSISRHWLVNFGNLEEGPAAQAEDRAFVAGGEPAADLVRRAARLTGADVVALDYARRPDGSVVFWEANRHFLMLGDPGYEQPGRMHAATGRSDEERRAEDEAVGLAVADLVLERARAAA
ncbi:MAG TPA: hypothetical protein VHQ65_04725 [Thermoanaerobaculia bacterium]|nr:hypothetical protein [Thermoanaerobaculia bacterium]